MTDSWEAEGLPPPGSVLLDRYRLDEAVARGGMSMVYRGHDLEESRRVAVKVLPQRLRTERSHARFLREARLAAQVVHPNVVETFDAGLVGEAPFLVMEWLTGDTLYQRIRSRGPFPLTDAVLVMGYVLEGVSAAHSVGVIHRDLKPSNVLLGDEVKVIDFGLSKDVRDRGPQLTGPREALGTPSYMSPEQVLADPVDARSDVWGAGAVFYEMVTGKRAFPRATAPPGPKRDLQVRDTFALILNEDPPAPSTLAPLPKAVDEWVARALAKMPEDRFQSMAEMREATEALYRAR